MFRCGYLLFEILCLIGLIYGWITCFGDAFTYTPTVRGWRVLLPVPGLHSLLLLYIYIINEPSGRTVCLRRNSSRSCPQMLHGRLAACTNSHSPNYATTDPRARRDWCCAEVRMLCKAPRYRDSRRGHGGQTGKLQLPSSGLRIRGQIYLSEIAPIMTMKVCQTLSSNS